MTAVRSRRVGNLTKWTAATAGLAVLVAATTVFAQARTRPAAPDRALAQFNTQGLTIPRDQARCPMPAPTWAGLSGTCACMPMSTASTPSGSA